MQEGIKLHNIQWSLHPATSLGFLLPSQSRWQDVNEAHVLFVDVVQKFFFPIHSLKTYAIRCKGNYRSGFP